MAQRRAPDTRKHVPEDLAKICLTQGSKSHRDVYRLDDTLERSLYQSLNQQGTVPEIVKCIASGKL